MAFAPLSAKNAKVRIGSNVLTSKKWSVKYKGDQLDTSNFEGGGFYSYIGGLKGLDITIEIDFDNNTGASAGTTSGGNLFDASPGSAIVPGTTIATAQLFTNDTGSANWTLGSFYIADVTMNADVKGTIAATITGSASGSFQIPSGTTTSRTSP